MGALSIGGRGLGEAGWVRVIVTEDSGPTPPRRAVDIDERLRIDFEVGPRGRVDIAGGLNVFDAAVRAEQQAAAFERQRVLRFSQQPFQQISCQHDLHPHFP
jgi:hypothetical protein